MRRKTKDEFIRELFDEMYENLCFYVFKRYRDRDFAEDVVQETFLEAYRHADKLMTHPQPKAWLYVTAKNLTMKFARRRGMLYPIEDDYLLVCRDDEGYGEIELAESIKSSVGETEYNMFRDYYANGYSSEEVAKRYDANKGGIRMRMSRMKKKLENDIPKGWILFVFCIGRMFYGL